MAQENNNPLYRMRDKLTHGAMKVAIPMAIHYSWAMFKNDNCIVRGHSDMRDSRNRMYKDHYYKMITEVVNNKYHFDENHPITKGIAVAFTLLDSDEAYEEGLRAFYEAEEDYFYEMFKNGRSGRYKI